MFQCANGASVGIEHRCVYQGGEFGVLLGCRDASHLVDCGENHSRACIGMQSCVFTIIVR